MAASSVMTTLQSHALTHSHTNTEIHPKSTPILLVPTMHINIYTSEIIHHSGLDGRVLHIHTAWPDYETHVEGMLPSTYMTQTIEPAQSHAHNIQNGMSCSCSLGESFLKEWSLSAES